jgi:uncharacterized MAPEG superfamily protein
MATKMSEKLNGFCERDRINALKLNSWFTVFAILTAIGAIVLGPVAGSLADTPLWHWVLAFLPVVPGYFALIAYIRFITVADELIRQVHFEAASNSFIVVILAGFILNFASQILGQWEDSGAILWFLGIVSYVINIRRAWRTLDV